MLHCIQHAETGGENFIVDARQAVNYLRSIDEHSYHMLTKTKIKFHRKQKNFESVQERPIIELDEMGNFVKIRYSYFTMAPYKAPFNQMEAWYK